MSRKFIGLLLGVLIISFAGAKNVKAVDYETALKLQEEATKHYYDMLAEQGAVAANTTKVADNTAQAQQQAAQAQQQAALAQQQILSDAVAAQQKALQDSLTAQQKAANEALAAQQKLAAEAQQKALETAAAIQAANAVVPQLDVICDTNCAEKNALLYAKSVPDFVLVDISEQKAIFYKNGTKVLIDNCVTGNSSAKHDTTVGIHQILFKDLNRTLHGSYGEAFVRYWMRFTKDGQGLHDAGWRNKFGSTIYVTNGSHGCVNLTRNTAKTIYENSYVGMFVIVEN